MTAPVSTIDDRVRQLVVLVARARVGAGAAMLAAAGPLARAAVGDTQPGGRAALRFAGGRDLALGIGTLTSVRESTQGPDWVSMGALVDGIDAVVLLVTPRLPWRSRLLGLVAGATAVAGWLAAQRLADAEAAATPA